MKEWTKKSRIQKTVIIINIFYFTKKNNSRINEAIF